MCVHASLYCGFNETEFNKVKFIFMHIFVQILCIIDQINKNNNDSIFTPIWHRNKRISSRTNMVCNKPE